MKRIAAAALILVLLFSLSSAYAGSAGTAADPFVSLSYLNGVYKQQLLTEIEQRYKLDFSKVYDNKLEELQTIGRVLKITAGGDATYSLTSSFKQFSMPFGKAVSLVTGSSIILMSGSAYVSIEAGTVINVSTGESVPSNSELKLNQRYFCVEATSVIISSYADSVCLIDGFYKTDGVSAVAPPVFLDVNPSDWFYAAVDYVYNRGLFTGTGANTFSPSTSMNRAMFVTVLHRLAGTPGVTGASKFSDVTDQAQYYYNAVIWANANGIVTGFDNGTFQPGTNITREQMAVIMYRFAQGNGVYMDGGNTSVYDAFPDKGSVSDFAVDAMRWAAANGIINGSDGKLAPKATASRAQVAQIIYNYCQKFG